MIIKNKYFFCLVILINFYSLFSQAPSIEWQKTYGGSSYEYGYSIQQTSFDNGYVFLGSSESTDGDMTLNHGLADYVVIKTNGAGVLQWQYSYGGSNYDVGSCIKQTSDGGFILCGQASSNDGDATVNHGDSDYWIVKLNSTGGIQWQKSFGGSLEDNGSYISETTDGGYIIGGYSGSNDFDVNGNHGSFDYFVIKINSAGSIEWKKTYGGTGFENGGPVIQTNDGGYIICSSTNSNDGDVSGNNGTYDYWIVKINSTGIIQWQKTFGGTGNDFARDIKQTSDGGYIVCGVTNSINGDVTNNHGNDDFWIVKINSSGILQWQKTYGGTLFDYANSIIQTTEGGYLISGRSNSTDGDKTNNNGVYDNWLVKISASGAIEWEKNFGGSVDEDSKSVISTVDGGVIVCGSSTSNNGDVSGNHGASDIWVVKFSSILDLKQFYNNNDLLLFPNPCKNDLVVKTKFSDEKTSISIVDLNGKLIQTQTTISKGDKANFKINIENGVYLLKVHYEDQSEVLSKLIISDN